MIIRWLVVVIASVIFPHLPPTGKYLALLGLADINGTLIWSSGEREANKIEEDVLVGHVLLDDALDLTYRRSQDSNERARRKIMLDCKALSAFQPSKLGRVYGDVKKQIEMIEKK